MLEIDVSEGGQQAVDVPRHHPRGHLATSRAAARVHRELGGLLGLLRVRCPILGGARQATGADGSDMAQDPPLPELHWNVDLHQPPRPGQSKPGQGKPGDGAEPLARALTHQFALPPAAAKLRASQPQRPLPGAPDASAGPGGGHVRPRAAGAPAAKEDRPATALAAQPRANPLPDSSALQRSASCDIAWRLPKALQPPPRAGASPLGASGDKARPVQPGSEPAAVMPQAKRSSLGPSATAARSPAVPKADSLKQATQPSPATADPDAASLRRCAWLRGLGGLPARAHCRRLSRCGAGPS